MTEVSAKKDRGENIASLKKDVHTAKADLNELSKTKQALASKKQQLWDDLGPVIKRFNEVKRFLDSADSVQKKLRQERDLWNKQCQTLIGKAKKLQEEKLKLFKKHNIKENIERLQVMIEKLETKIETEALTIPQEKKVMVQLKELKAKAKEHTVVRKILSELKVLSKEIDTVKAKGNDAHAKLKEAMKQRKLHFKEFMDLSKKINADKSLQQEAAKELRSVQKKVGKKSKQLKQGLHKVGKAAARVKDKFTTDTTQKQQKEAKLIQEKAQEVEKKLKQKKKLTTEDLLVFQQKKE